jgi:aspartyl/asparaginyl beta-hydroxylase (cupin superfamily)
MESARFLRLGAGANIREHRDYQLGFEDGFARIHIPVQTNRQVEFYLDGQSIEMSEGEAWYLNFNLKHRVSNGGETDRVHLVVDCLLNDWLRSFFPHEEQKIEIS